MKERLQGSDYRFIAICLGLLAVTTWYAAGNFFRAFPEASIDFRVNRADGEGLAAQFLSEQQYNTSGYRQASRFSYDDETKTFLEREFGLERANQLMGARIRLWRWSYRWFRPQQKEEYRAEITPKGEVAGFEHVIAEDAARADVAAEQARAMAEEFLRTRMRRAPESLDFVEESDTVRPKRTDRTFTWKERDFELHDATYRVAVTVLGNEIGGYSEYLKVPEQWSRDYERLRSRNSAASTVDLAVTLVLLVGLVAVIVIRVRRQDIRWRRAGVIALIGMALSFCASMNQFPLREFDYPTTDAYGSFLMRQLLQALGSALGAGGLLFLLTAGAEPLYREAFPDKISLGSLFRARGLRTKRFFLGAILGIALTGVFVAYQTAFYIFAYRFGAWSPADVPYDDLLNTSFPWLYVLFGGFLPAVSEEFLFRMFGITFLRKVLRSLPAALVLAGFIWGFGHSAYPQQPFYIRGVEVGIGGVALGLVMMRWGILPTLVWHYSVDAMYSAMLLLRSQSLYYRLSGAASAGVVLLPVAVALIAYWRKGGFEPETGLRNGDETPPAEEPAPAPAGGAEPKIAGYRPLTGRLRLTAAAVCAIGLASLLIPAAEFGDSPRYAITADQARASADAFLRSQGANPDAFRHVTFPGARSSGSDELAAKYFLERRPVTAASALFERNRPVHHWLTRYFKPLDKEEWIVSVHPETGKAMVFSHSLPEDRPGADIDNEPARAIAAAAAASFGLDVSGMDLKENRSEKKKARRDHTLVWEAPAGDPRNVDETRFRIEVDVAGDQPAALRTYWHVPESFERMRSQQNAISIGALGLRIAALAGGVVCGLWFLVAYIRQGVVPWKATIRIAAPAAVLTLVAPLLSWQQTLQNYPTAIPIETFQAINGVVIAMSAVVAFLILGGAAALTMSAFPGTAGLLRAKERAVFGWDAGFALLGAIGLALLATRLDAVLADRLHALAQVDVSAPNLIVSAAPAVAALASSVRSIMVYGAVLAVAALLWSKLRNGWLIAAAGLLAAFVRVSSDVRTPGEFALEYGTALAVVAAAAAFCRWFARDNYLAYALVLWLFALRGAIAELLGNPMPGLTLQARIVVAAAAAGVGWAIAPAIAKRKAYAADFDPR